MNVIESCTVRQAIERGFLEVAATAAVAPDVRIVPVEDDGSSAGIVRIGPKSRIREGAIICSGVEIGTDTIVGHQVVIRRGARLGSHSVVSHLVCIERDVRIGDRVRISALTHLTAECLIEDDVQIGARVVTINDNDLRWRRNPNWMPPVFRRGCRVASGSTVLAGVEIGPHALVGAGAVVTRNVPAGVVAYGVPAYAQRDRSPEEIAATGPAD